MGILSDVREQIRAAVRAFVLGPGTVTASQTSYGKSPDEYQPAAYGDYLRTSNGVYACATGRADLLAGLQLKLYKRQARGDRREVTSGRAWDLLHKVNPFWTSRRLLYMTELARCLWGESFWFLERGERQAAPPREIWWGRPDRVRIHPDPEQYIAGYTYVPSNNVDGIRFDPSEVIWMPFPNPLDEYEGLSPLGAARVAADYATHAMRTNVALYDNGLSVGGMIIPKGQTGMTEDQALELERVIDRRFSGADKRHRWGVLRFEADLKSATDLTPRDAEFLGGLKWSLEDICRAYKWPIDLVGGQRTYENFGEALKAAYTHAVLPEADVIAADITEQLLPMFGAEADEAEFDRAQIDALREAEAQEWQRASEQLTKGALTINAWRESRGQQPVPWGDVWWAPAGVMPVSGGELPVATLENAPEPTQGQQSARRPQTRAIAYGGDEHRRLWEEHVTRTAKLEQPVARMSADIFRRQRDSVIARLRAELQAGGPARGRRSVIDDPFDLNEWIRETRGQARPVIELVIAQAGEDAMRDLALGLLFDGAAPETVRFLENRAQRFARLINETTWERLRASLAEGLTAGEGLDKMIARVEAVMGDRIRSSGETIARTEVIGAYNGGTLLAWEQSGVVQEKVWLAALDDRTRPSHIDAHVRYNTAPIPLNALFEVGAARGPAPGQLGAPEEDVNCRCRMVPIVRPATGQTGA